ncbi:MAG: type II toxin-antitoxin system prevent-host-death family antitoxin [Microbacterium sp.]
MSTITATAASRRFSDVLDRVEAGETVRISRGGQVIAELRPASPHTGKGLRAALAGVSRTDDADLETMLSDLDTTRELLTDGSHSWSDD